MFRLLFFTFLNSVPDGVTAHWQDGFLWLNLIIIPLDRKSEFHGDNSRICIFPFNAIVGRAYNHSLWLSGAQFLNTDVEVSF